jgi:hypothetical protein
MLMKAIVFILLVEICTVSLNAQSKIEWEFEQMKQDQLNHSLSVAKSTTAVGKVFTLGGFGVQCVGVVLLATSPTEFDPNYPGNLLYATTDWRGGGVYLTGLLFTVIGIPVWISGAIQKNRIKLELVKFYPPGSASINGIGLKVRF